MEPIKACSAVSIFLWTVGQIPHGLKVILKVDQLFYLSCLYIYGHYNIFDRILFLVVYQTDEFILLFRVQKVMMKFISIGRQFGANRPVPPLHPAK